MTQVKKGTNGHINIALPTELLERLRKCAIDDDSGRSRVVRIALREYLEREGY